MGSKTITKAAVINVQVRSAKFIVPFGVCHYVFGFSKGLVRQLQGTAMDMTTAFDKVDLAISELKEIHREDIDEFRKLFQFCLKTAESVEMPQVKPRVIGCQTLRSNVRAESLEGYFRRSIFITFVDDLVT